jgi:hypothetical protein
MPSTARAVSACAVADAFTFLQILHAYMAEPYAPWAGLARGSEQYQHLKQQRAEQLWSLVDQVGIHVAVRLVLCNYLRC